MATYSRTDKKQFKLSAQRHRDRVNAELNSGKAVRTTKMGTIALGHRSQSNTSQDMINIRCVTASRAKRIKVSMPKMPWDN